jgi:nucleolar protein 56
VELESVGSEMAEEDIAIIRSVAGTLYELYQRKSDLDHYISEGMQKVAPNMTALLSANLAARLISLSGGLARLTKLPASTVQLLGAEKAMFMHLRSGKRPPKHGIIFQHPWVNRSPYWQRGKISRSLGGKISIACKVDYYKGEFIGDKLKKQMELRVDEVQKKYPNPPKRAPAPRPRWNNERKGRR